MSDRSTEFIPYCKVPRIIETIIAIVLLISWFIRIWEKDQIDSPGHIVNYITNGTFGIIFIIDVICQISGDPIDYTPMFLFLVTASVMYLCCATYLIVLTALEILEAAIINIIQIVLSFLMTVICIIDIHFLIHRKFGYK